MSSSRGKGGFVCLTSGRLNQEMRRRLFVTFRDAMGGYDPPSEVGSE